MTRKEYLKVIASEYYIDKEIRLEDLKSQVKFITPVFGKMQTEITKNDKEYVISLLDYDEVTSILKFDKNSGEAKVVELNEEEIKLYSTCTLLIEVTTDLKGIIKTVSCRINGLITPVNKNFNLFVGYLIGKKLTDII